MKKITLVAILFIGCMQNSFAQSQPDATADDKKEKVFEQTVGVQLNQLINQVFNFSNSSSLNTNPYLLNYSINLCKTGWGARAGVGYNYSTTSSNDGITSTDTKLNNLSFRVGLEKAFRLSKKWSAGVGLDFVYNDSKDHTTNSVNSTFGNPGSTTDTKTTTTSSGGGPMAWLRYYITDKILIGTEASFYYTSGKQNQTVIVIDPSTAPVTTPSSTKTGEGTFSSPIVFFLSVKF